MTPTDGSHYLSLSELLIIKGEYQKSLDTTIKALALSLELKYQAIGKYFECITRKLLDLDVSEYTADLDFILSQDFTHTWSFDEIVSWLKETDISEDKKVFIKCLTEQIEKHKTQ